jgi:hypothetical protein
MTPRNSEPSNRQLLSGFALKGFCRSNAAGYAFRKGHLHSPASVKRTRYPVQTSAKALLRASARLLQGLPGTGLSLCSIGPRQLRRKSLAIGLTSHDSRPQSQPSLKQALALGRWSRAIRVVRLRRWRTRRTGAADDANTAGFRGRRFVGSRIETRELSRLICVHPFNPQDPRPPDLTAVRTPVEDHVRHRCRPCF